MNPMEKADAPYQRILHEVVPEVIDRFKEKAVDYSGSPAFLFLGMKGQFSDINRKFWKLYIAMWEGHELQSESLDEVLDDVIGHCLLAKYLLLVDREKVTDILAGAISSGKIADEDDDIAFPTNRPRDAMGADIVFLQSVCTNCDNPVKLTWQGWGHTRSVLCNDPQPAPLSNEGIPM